MNKYLVYQWNFLNRRYEPLKSFASFSQARFYFYFLNMLGVSSIVVRNPHPRYALDS